MHSSLGRKRGLKSSGAESSVRARDQDCSDARDRASISARGIYRQEETTDGEQRKQTHTATHKKLDTTHRKYLQLAEPCAFETRCVKVEECSRGGEQRI